MDKSGSIQYSFKVVAVLLVILIKSQIVLCQFAGGDGTYNSPYLVATAEQLAYVSDKTSAYYKQTCDIDLTQYISQTSTKGWYPIGSNYDPFKGKYDGNGFKISGLKIQRTTDNIGLFGCIEGADIKNVTLENVDIKGGNYCGALVGKVVKSSINNIKVTGNVNGLKNVGGVIGIASQKNKNTNTISAIKFEGGLIESTSTAGGVFGQIEVQYDNITNGYSQDGNFYRKEESDYSYINNCYCENTELSGDSIIGGIVGLVYLNISERNKWMMGSGYNYCEGTFDYRFDLKDCSFIGKIDANNGVGGIIGHLYTKSTSIAESKTGIYSDFDNHTYSFTSIGTSKCYPITRVIGCGVCGNISGKSDVGGIIGLSKGESEGECVLSGNATYASTYASPSFVIEQCMVLADVRGSANNIGGAVGRCTKETLNAEKASKVSNTISVGNVIVGRDYVGGILGCSDEQIEILKCFSQSQVSGAHNVGGIIGKGEYATLSYNVSAMQSLYGIGEVYRVGQAKINNSNKASSAIACFMDGTPREFDEDVEANGRSIPESSIFIGNTYHSMGWDLSSVWKIKEEESFPFLRKQTDVHPLKMQFTKKEESRIACQVNMVNDENVYVSFKNDIFKGEKQDEFWSIELPNAKVGDEIVVYSAKPSRFLSLPTKYTIDNVSESSKLPDVLTSSYVKVDGITINIISQKSNVLTKVYNDCGLLIYSGYDKTIDIPRRGIYIVIFDGQCHKVLI